MARWRYADNAADLGAVLREITGDNITLDQKPLLW